MSSKVSFFRRHPERDGFDEVLGHTGRIYLLGIAGILLVTAPLLNSMSPSILFLLTRILIFALLALSLDFVFGYTGLPSFGHAAMFGMGGYVAAFAIMDGVRSLLLVLPATFIAGTVTAAIIGWLSVRSHGIYFAMLTLAFAQVLYIISFDDLPATILGLDTLTGGDNGLIVLHSYSVLGIDTSPDLIYYYLVLVVTALSVLVLLRVANSPVGRVFQGISENQERIDALGYDVTRYKVVAFSLSGGFAGLAGGLWVPLQTIAHPNLLHWQLSGELIVMVLLGGMGSLWGPMFGATLVILLEEFLSSMVGWRLILGAVFMIVVIFAPQGFAGIARSEKRESESVPERIRSGLDRYVRKVRR